MAHTDLFKTFYYLFPITPAGKTISPAAGFISHFITPHGGKKKLFVAFTMLDMRDLKIRDKQK